MKMDGVLVEKNFREMLKALIESQNPEMALDFFRCLLTPRELQDIASRWELVKALDRQVPQRKIAGDLGISLCKITRGSRELKKPGSAFRRILDLSTQERQNGL
jgi:TrpR family trp operon transcriptional repressor